MEVVILGLLVKFTKKSRYKQTLMKLQEMNEDHAISEFKQKESDRSRLYRQMMSEDARISYNLKTAARMRQYHTRKRIDSTVFSHKTFDKA